MALNPTIFPIHLQSGHIYKCVTGNASGYMTEKFQKRSDVSSRWTRNSDYIPLYILNSMWSMNNSVQSGIIAEFVVTRYETL